MRTIDLTILWNMARRLWRNRRARRAQGRYPLETLLFYVTMRCNSKCSHCFCWRELNQGHAELSLAEIEKFAASLAAPLRHLVLTGGEPTLRPDLLEVMFAFARQGKVETLLLNTNGLQPAKLAALAEAFKREFPYVGLEIQVSLDGLEESHDRLRGVPGGFKKAVESLKAILALKPRHPNLSAHALTVITADNYKELVALDDFLRREIHPEILHGFELVRGVQTSAWGIPGEIAEEGMQPKSMSLPPVENFAAIANDLRRIQRRFPFHASSFLVHNLAQLRMVETRRPQYPCVTAGQSVGVVYAAGETAHCEFTRPFAKLADYDFNFTALWNGPEAEARRRQIKRCFCTHGCFHGPAVEYSWKGIWETFRKAI